MGYFNYFIKCLIRRFVRLFFTRKTFIFLLILAFVIVLSFNSFACASSFVTQSKTSIYLYTNSSKVFAAPEPVYTGTSAVSAIVYRNQFAVYYIEPGYVYRFTSSSLSSLPGYYCYDIDFIKYVRNDSVHGTGTSVPGTATQDVPCWQINSANYVVGPEFSTSVAYYYLVDLSVVNYYSFDLEFYSTSVTSSDIQSVQSSVENTSKETQNTIKDTSQQMQNTITDSSVDVSTDLPTDNTQDITESGFNNIFTIIRNTFTSSSSQDLVLTIPFTGKSFTINFANVYRWF